MVTDSSSGTGGGGRGRQPLFRYSDKFKELCPYYLSIGMTYDDYWNGDCEMVIYYRKAHRMRIEEQNTNLWLQGRYIYEALMDVAPAFCAFSKSRPQEYRDKPYQLFEKAEKANEKKKLDASAAAMMSLATEINKGRRQNGRDNISGVQNRSGHEGRNDQPGETPQDDGEVKLAEVLRRKRVPEDGQQDRTVSEHS